MSSTDDPRLHSIWGPIRTSVGWWAKPTSSKVANGDAIDVASGNLRAGFAEWLADDLIAQGMSRMTQVAMAAGQSRALIAQMQATAMRLRTLAPAWAHYLACGRQIFDFSPGLVEALLNTDIGETKLAGLRSPYGAFFVRFGPQPHLSLPWDDKAEYVDGAYFSFQRGESEHPDVIMCLTMVFAEGKGMLSQGPTIHIPGRYFELPVHEALERAVADVEAFAHGAHEGVQNNPRGQFAELGPALLREGLETADIFRRALPLLVSSLYYLSDPPKSDPVPASDTPEPLARKVREAGTPNARRKALSSLFGHGYAMVRLCGQEFQTEANATRGMSTKCHWRRGHFRDQRHGEGLALVKRLWIHPTLVSSDAGAPAEGHIYRADQLPPASPD